MASSSSPKIVPRRSSDRGHANHGWLNTYHTFSFAHYFDPAFQRFGSLRVLNEDRVAPRSGFPTHPHRDAEIFSYILSGTLTHRDSMTSGLSSSSYDDDHDDHDNDTTAASLSSLGKDKYYNMRRGDVQFTTGGTGIAHSEMNEHASEPVHFLQIWVLPWSRGLPPTYHTSSFDEAAKYNGFVTFISPLAAGPGASLQQEKEARPAVEGTIPIHADLLAGAGIVKPGKTFKWRVGDGDAAAEEGGNTGVKVEGGAVRSKQDRHVYIHVPQTAGTKTARVRVNGAQELAEGDGAFVTKVNAGDVLSFESFGDADAEIIVLDGE